MQSQNTADTTDTTYNGWTNRETWMVNLWLTNDAGTYEYLAEFCQNVGPETVRVSDAFTYERERVHVLAALLPDFIAEIIDPNEQRYEANAIGDLLTYALAKVDYTQLAAHFIEDFPYTDNA